VDPEHCRIIQ